MTGTPTTRARPDGPREVVSFVRRSARMGTQQQRAWDAHAASWVLEVPRTDTDTSVDPAFSVDLAAVFGRRAPLVVEIGSGMGGSLVPMARDRPDLDLLAFEVYRPAVARTLVKLAREGVSNVRLVQADAVAGLRTLVPAAAVSELWVFFPDPWPKTRQQKRRLVNPSFAALAATRLAPGGRLRLATDDPGYADQMRTVLDAEPGLVDEHPGGWAPRWAARPVSRFEERARSAGRDVLDLCYRRR